jgi:hypothetical protein
MKKDQDPKWEVLKIFPTDYVDYGGAIERWKFIDLDYPDCSSGCKWFIQLYNEEYDSADGDWGVCTNPRSPRAGLLTWEHQAGFKCFEYRKTKDDR